MNELNKDIADKGLDVIKLILDKISDNPIAEASAIFGDKVKVWRLKNQISLLKKTEIILKKHKMSVKDINFRQIFTLLEPASLEEDEDMQQKWAILLANLLDSEQNIQSHVFPGILKEISKKEIEVIQLVYLSKKQSESFYQTQLVENEKKLEDVNTKISHYHISQYFEQSGKHTHEYNVLVGLRVAIEKDVNDLNYLVSHPETIAENKLETYEFANLIRLGIVEKEKSYFTSTYSDGLGNQGGSNDLHQFSRHLLNPLGEKFVAILQEKTSK